MTNFEKVELFMRTFGQEIKKSSLSTDNINKLRISLIEEELNEFKEAIKNRDLKRGSRCINRYSICNLRRRTRIWYKFRYLF